MKFVHYLKEVDHVAVYPLIVLALFFSFFLFILIRTLTAGKEQMDHFGKLPLDNEKTKNLAS